MIRLLHLSDLVGQPQNWPRYRVAYQRGQWEPNGGMYIEADCNIPDGESLIRQFLVGRPDH